MGHRIYDMSFKGVYQALLAKVDRKGHPIDTVHEITAWLTGYSVGEILDMVSSDITYGDFFRKAPHYHPDRVNITGKICGVRIEELEDSLMQDIRRLDKLVDWLAKGKTVQQIREKYQKG